MQRPQELPLAGVRVIDFSRVLAGPLVTQTLGDLGAEVIKIERPGHGDDTRTWGPPWTSDGGATYYESLNRNKRSIVLDLFDPDDLDVAAALAASATSSSTISGRGSWPSEGSTGHLGRIQSGRRHLHHHRVRGRRARGGVARLRPGRAGDGWPHAHDGRGRRASQPGRVPIVDMSTGLYAAIGVLAALADARTTGEGRHVEVSLFDTALASLNNHGTATTMGGADPRRAGNRHPSIAPYESYRAADGDLIIAAANNKLFANVCAALDRPDLLDDPRFVDNPTRRAHIDELADELERTLADDGRDAWVRRLRDHQVPCGPIFSVTEALAWGDEMGLSPTVADPDGRYVGIRSPIRFDGEVPTQAMAPPRLDEHGPAIRAEAEGG